MLEVTRQVLTFGGGHAFRLHSSKDHYSFLLAYTAPTRPRFVTSQSANDLARTAEAVYPLAEDRPPHNCRSCPT